MDATEQTVTVSFDCVSTRSGCQPAGVSEGWTLTLKRVGHVVSVNSDASISCRCLNSRNNSYISKAKVLKKRVLCRNKPSRI